MHHAALAVDRSGRSTRAWVCRCTSRPLALRTGGRWPAAGTAPAAIAATTRLGGRATRSAPGHPRPRPRWPGRRRTAVLDLHLEVEQVADRLLLDARPSSPRTCRSPRAGTRPAGRAGPSRAGRCPPAGSPSRRGARATCGRAPRARPAARARASTSVAELLLAPVVAPRARRP